MLVTENQLDEWVRGNARDAQGDWTRRRRDLADWKDIRVVDGTRLIDWLSHFPAVEQWLAQRMELLVGSLETPEQVWTLLSAVGAPPPLSTEVFLVNREEA